jgi:hypothetical protein
MVGWVLVQYAGRNVAGGLRCIAGPSGLWPGRAALQGWERH